MSDNVAQDSMSLILKSTGGSCTEVASCGLRPRTHWRGCDSGAAALIRFYFQMHTFISTHAICLRLVTIIISMGELSEHVVDTSKLYATINRMLVDPYLC